MSLLDGIRHRLSVLGGARRYARELDEEMHFHLALESMQHEHAGRGSLSALDARGAARKRFGNLTMLTEDSRAMAGLSFFDAIARDARFALRTFRRSPTFTVVAVLTLAIGIGANTAIFSAVDALLLRPLPFPNPERLMKVSLTVPARHGDPARTDMVWSYPKYAVFRDAQKLFSDVGIYTDDRVTLSGGSDAERVRTEVTSGGYLRTLGVHPALGRDFLPEEDAHPDGPRVVLLSDELWKRRYNANPAILGTVVDIDSKPFTVVGVLPAGFLGLSGRAELFEPLMSYPAEEVNEAWNHSYTLVARLRPNVTPEQAKADVPRLGALVDRAYPHPDDHDEAWGAIARNLDATRVDPMVRRSLLVLLSAVGLVLLIACANVANLFLVRAAGRRREIAVRLAVGAGRARLIRQLLTESVILAVIGGLASVVVAWWGVKLFGALDPGSALRMGEVTGIGSVNFTTVHLDGRALAFATIVAIATGVLFGLVPALQATHPSLTGALKEESGAAREGAPRGLMSRNVLVTLEIALAVVLLAGSGLMMRSLGKLLGVNPGFDASHTLTMRFNVPPGYGRDSLPGFYDDVLQRLGALPGVSGAELIDCPPLNGGCNGTAIKFRDRPPVAAGTEPDVGVHWVTPGWMAMMHVPLVRGRFFDRSDRTGVRKVVLVTQAAARKFWPNEDPIEKPVSIGQGGFWNDTAYVVGIVGDVRFGTVDSAAIPETFLSYYQSPRGSMMVMLRTAGDPLLVGPAARRVLAQMMPGAPVYDMRPMADRVSDSLAYARFSTILLALFGLVALALATMGTYGVISFGVAQRTREIGIRVALGAPRGDLLRMIVRQGLVLALAGAVAGVLVALAATRVLRSFLYDVLPSDPATFGAILAILAFAVLAATWIPARRAASVDPSEALREG
jgi:predicted permease